MAEEQKKEKFVSATNEEMAERCFNDDRLDTIHQLAMEEVNIAGLEHELEDLSERTDLTMEDKEKNLQTCKDNIELKARRIKALRGKLAIVEKLEKNIKKFLKG